MMYGVLKVGEKFAFQGQAVAQKLTRYCCAGKICSFAKISPAEEMQSNAIILALFFQVTFFKN